MRKIFTSYLLALLGIGLLAGCGSSSVVVSSSNSPNVSNTTLNSTTSPINTLTTNTASNSTQPAVQHQSQKTNATSKLHMYSAGTLTADHAVRWPGVQKNPNRYSTKVKVVQIPFTSAVQTPTLTAPKTISTSLPPQLSSKFTAYFVQMSGTKSFYLLGPSGMTGGADAAADGSFDVYLHSAYASIEMDTSGASPLAANGMAAPFFSRARAAQTNGSSSNKEGQLAPATVLRPNANTAYFAFSTKDGQNVAGWNDYLPQPSKGTARMIYKSDSQDWSYAPYVLRAGVNLLNNVIAPQIGKTIEQPKSSAVKVNGQTVTIPNSDGHVLQTPKGLAWIWQSATALRGSSHSPWSQVPTNSYGLAFAVPHKGEIRPNSVIFKQTIPATHVINGDNNAVYAYPRISSITANRWIIYSVTWSQPGMNQPYGNDLNVYDLQSGHATKITSFLNAGGMFFSIGTSGQYLVYDKSHITGVKGNTVSSVWMVNLATGKKTKLPSQDLIKSNNASGQSVRVSLQGKTLTVPLRQW